MTLAYIVLNISCRLGGIITEKMSRFRKKEEGNNAMSSVFNVLIFIAVEFLVRDQDS
jgi:hypothetical protein